MARKRKKKPSLGRTLRGLRKENGMSQTALAAAAEMSQGYLSQIENDAVQNPSVAVLFWLAAALQTDPRILMEVAGYTLGVDFHQEEDHFKPPADPDLLHFVSGMPLPRQQALLAYLKGADKGKGLT